MLTDSISPELVFDRLMSIQKKHRRYFKENDLDIFRFVYIHWQPLTFLIINEKLPEDIWQEILNIPFL